MLSPTPLTSRPAGWGVGTEAEVWLGWGHSCRAVPRVGPGPHLQHLTLGVGVDEAERANKAMPRSPLARRGLGSHYLLPGRCPSTALSLLLAPLPLAPRARLGLRPLEVGAVVCKCVPEILAVTLNPQGDTIRRWGLWCL